MPITQDSLTVVRYDVPGFDPFAKARTRKALERQLADLTKGDLAAMLGCSLILSGKAPTNYTPTPEQQQLIDQLQALGAR